MPNHQQKIDLEVRAMRLLGSLVAMGAILKIDRITEPMAWLIKRGFIARDKGLWGATSEGRDYYASATRNPVIAAQAGRQWRTEVLTGAREEPGKCGPRMVPTNVQNAALPKPEKQQYDSPHDLVQAYRESKAAQKQVAQDLGVTHEQLLAYASEGRLRVCKRGGPHWGIFDRSYARANGWQSWCRACRKAKRGRG